MRLQTKLVGSFGAVVALTLFVSALGTWEVRKLGLALYEIGVVRLPSIEGLNALTRESVALDASQRTLLLRSLPESTLTVELARQQTAWANARQGWRLYEPLPQSSDEAVEWKAFVVAWRDWERAYAVTDSLAVRAHRDHSDALHDSATLQYRSTSAALAKASLLLSAITTINDQIVVSTKNATVASYQDMLTAQGVMLLCAILGLLAAIGYAAYMGRHVVSPLSGMSDTLARVAKGDLDVRVPVRSRDEIGQMAVSLNGMVDALRTTEDRIRSGMQYSTIGMSFVTPEGNWLEINPAMCEITGFTRAELLGREYQSIIHPDDRPNSRFQRQQLIDRVTESHTAERRIIRKDGSIVWAQLNVSLVWKANGTPDYFVIQVQDITERRHANDELSMHRHNLEELVQERTTTLNLAITGADLGTWDYDVRTSTLTGSDRCREMLGVPLDVPFSLASFVAAVHPDDRTRTKEAGTLSLAGRDYTADYRVVWPDESVHWISARGRTLRDAQGVPTRVSGIVQDITHLVKVSDELTRAKEAAESASRAKGAFLANMSHEIRTPMNAILGFAQLMFRDPSLSAQHRQHADIITRSGEHLLTLINDVLEMSKIEAGRVTLNYDTFDLHRFLTDVTEMFRLPAEAKRLRIRLVCPDTVPHHIKTDEGKLRQILINLVGNAVKFTSQGGITIRVNSERNNTRLLIDVEDTGPGIGEEDQQRLFRYFEQTSSGQLEGGTGLGLAISREFVTLLGGEIRVTSALGTGSTFHFEIDIEAGDPDDMEPHSARRLVHHLASSQPTMRVLIADDKSENRNLLTRLLEPVGFETRTASEGAEAVSLFKEWRPHLILMDLRMPGMSGLDAIRRIRDLPQGLDPRIIAVTASAFQKERMEVIEAGANDVLVKPFREVDLFEKIREHTGAEYVYFDTHSSVQPLDTAIPDVTSEMLAIALPADLRGRLRDAARQVDLDLVLTLIDEAETTAPDLARDLRVRAERYEFDDLLKLLDPHAMADRNSGV